MLRRVGRRIQIDQDTLSAVQGLVYIFIVLAALGVAAAAYFGLTFTPIEALVTAICFGAVAVVLLERQLRRRSEARLEKTIEDMARLLSTDARAGQVLSQRVNAMADAGNRLDGIEDDISVLGTVVRQVAESVAELEEAQKRDAEPKAANAAKAAVPTEAAPAEEEEEDTFPDPPISAEELAAALEDNRLVFHIEPIVTLPQRRPQGYDLVPRLMQSDGGLAEPAEFMPRHGSEDLIRRIEARALDEAVVIARRSRSAGAPIRLFVPLSAATLHDASAMERRLVVLSANQAIAGAMMFLVPHADFKAAEPAAKQQMIELRKAGIGFAMGDVSSLRLDYGELEGLGFSSVRFDASTFLDRPRNLTDLHTGDVAAYVRRFEIDLCATGISDEQQLLGVFEDGIKLAQGPFIGQPGPVRPDLVLSRPPAGAGRDAATARG